MTDLSWFKAEAARTQLKRVLRDMGLVRVDVNALYSMRLMENAQDTIQRVISNLDVDAPMIVHAVTFGNYFPQEIDSIWLDAVEAQKRADEVNATDDPELRRFYVSQMRLNDEWRARG